MDAPRARRPQHKWTDEELLDLLEWHDALRALGTIKKKAHECGVDPNTLRTALYRARANRASIKGRVEFRRRKAARQIGIAAIAELERRV